MGRNIPVLLRREERWGHKGGKEGNPGCSTHLCCCLVPCLAFLNMAEGPGEASTKAEGRQKLEENKGQGGVGTETRGVEDAGNLVPSFSCH